MDGDTNAYSLWRFKFFFSFTKGLVERYPELFDGGGGDSGQHQINFAKKWKSYSSIIQLAGNDVTKIDGVVEEPLEKCLLYLSYQSDRALMEDLIHREIVARNKI